MGGRFCGLGSRLLNGSRRDASGQLNSLILRPERQRCHGTEVAPCDCSTQLPAVGVLDSLASVVGRSESVVVGVPRCCVGLVLEVSDRPGADSQGLWR